MAANPPADAPPARPVSDGTATGDPPRPCAFDVSVIVPSRNRRNCLEQCLLSLAGLTYPRDAYEVIVVDDGGADGLADLVARLGTSLPYAVRCERLATPSGISAARNRGMEVAAGRVFVFTDDDCLFEPRWLDGLLDPMAREGLGVVGGPDYAPSDAGFLCRCVGYMFTSFVGTGGLRGGRARVGAYYPKGCNVAVRRECIEEVGGFVESLAPGEEIELAYRIEKAGYKVGYAPSAFVWHNRQLSLGGYVRKMFAIGYTRVVLAHMHRGLLQVGHMIPFLCVLALLILGPLSLVSHAARFALAVLLAAYAALLAFSAVQAAVKMGDARCLLVMPLLGVLHHSVHGIGFLVGAVRHLLPRRSA